MTNCCCHKFVSWLWRMKLPEHVRQAVANMSLQTDYEATLQAADNSHRANNVMGTQIAGINAGTASMSLAGAEGGQLAPFTKSNRAKEGAVPRAEPTPGAVHAQTTPAKTSGQAVLLSRNRRNTLTTHQTDVAYNITTRANRHGFAWTHFHAHEFYFSLVALKFRVML